MAQKLNKKLVFVVGSLLIALVVGGAGVLLIRYRYDAERHIRAGDQAAAVGDFTKAAEAYGRAVQKKRTNVAYLEKFAEATGKIRSTTENDARERYLQYLQALASLARADRGNLERWRTYLDALVEQADAVGSVSAWKAISDTSSELALASQPASTGQAVAKVYSGYANLRRLDSLDDAERAGIAPKLEEAVVDQGLTPAERDLAYGTMARLAVLDLARARSAASDARIATATKTCDDTLALAQKNSPNGVQTAIAMFERAILDAKGNGSNPALLEKIDALRAAAEAAKPDGMQMMSLAAVLSRGGEEGAKTASALLADYCAKNPDALMQRRARALLVRPVDREEALKEIDAALAIERPATSIVAASFEGNRLSCALIRFDILHDAIGSADGLGREDAMRKAKTARDEVEKLLQGSTDPSPLLRADAKLDMSRNEFQAALIKLNEIFRKGSSVDLELYVLAAICSQQLGETGRALDFVSSGLQITPSNTQLLKLRAQLELRTGRGDAAAATLRQVRAIDPNDKEAAEIEERISRMVANDPGSATGATAGGAIADSFGRVQAALDARNFDLARQLITQMKASLAEPDVRMERLAVIVEMQAGDNAKAKQVAQAALEKFAGDGPLLRLNAVLSTNDPVERVIAMSEGDGGDAAIRPIMIYMRLLQSEAAVRELAEREKRLGSASAASTQQAATRLAEGLAEWRKKAEASDRLHPILIEADFREAMVKKDYAAAAGLVKLAKEGGRDVSQVPLLESQLLMEQGKSREAVEVLERAIQNGMDTSNVYRMLGSVIERQGNLEGAMRQYEEAYERKPEDMQTVRFLVGACVRAGNLTRALEVLRVARQVAGLDEEIASVWLSLEGQIGDRRTAMALRENQYRATPADTRNAIALATMLATLSPERVDVVTEGGEPAYSETAWLALSDAARNGAIDKTRSLWRKRSEDIFAAAMKREPSNIDVADPYSNLLRALGREAESEKVVADAVAAGGTAAGWRGLISLGNLQTQFNKREAAAASFDEAIRREDPKTRDATRTIVDLLVAQEVGRFDEARAVFTTAANASPERPFAEELLDGALSMALGDRLRGEGKPAEARTAYEAAVGPLQRAKALEPSAAQPFMQDALLKRKLYEVTGDRARLQEALASADKAVSLGVTAYPSCAVRADVLIAGGDVAGAITEFERLLKLVPTSVDARRRVIELCVGTNDLARAEASLRAAISIAPGEPSWFFALGDVLAQRNRFAEAASAFSRADALRPDPASFLREVDARIRAKDFRGVTDAARRRGDFVRTNSTARAYTGVALIAAGESSDGFRTLVESYQAALKTAESGDDRFVAEWYTAINLLYGPPEFQQAEELLKKVVGEGLDVQGRIYLASLASRSGSGGPQKAVAYLQPIEGNDFSKQPAAGALVFDLLGTASYLAGDCAKAVSSFEKAIALTPDSHSVLNNYAYLCGECLKDPKRGLPSARRAVQLSPGRPEYLDTLGKLLSLDGQYREALELLDRAAGIGNSPAIQYHRAQALVGLNRKDEARAACEQAAKLNPDEPTRKGIEELQQKLK
ncbi:MAG: tetratricopeptide repeat protein [Planctomycetota bacterium]|nr:tetratricopeptide repeat protein [Planctomycetota bacterium]